MTALPQLLDEDARCSLTILIYFYPPRVQLSFIYPNPRCCRNSLIRGAVKLIYFLAAGSRQLGSELPRRSGSCNCGVIIFTPLLGLCSDGRLTCRGNKAAINEPATLEYEGRVVLLSSKRAGWCRSVRNTHTHTDNLTFIKTVLKKS